MMRIFNTTGPCNPEMHYMVNIDKKLTQIKQLIDTGAYFTINKARQYGKTTTIKALTQYLSKEYIVLSLDFQALGNTEFQTEEKFSAAFAEECVELIRNTEAAVDSLDPLVVDELEKAAEQQPLPAKYHQQHQPPYRRLRAEPRRLLLQRVGRTIHTGREQGLPVLQELQVLLRQRLQRLPQHRFQVLE